MNNNNTNIKVHGQNLKSNSETVDDINESLYCFNWCIWINSMSQVNDVPFVLEFFQHSGYNLCQFLLWCVQGAGIQIALNCHVLVSNYRRNEIGVH